MATFFKDEPKVKEDPKVVTKDNIIVAFEDARQTMLSMSDSKAMPMVFDQGRTLLDKMVAGKFDIHDIAMFVQGFYKECQIQGRYPASLDAPICYALHQKNEDGTPGSVPDKPHYRELQQIGKNTGRMLVMVHLKGVLGRVFLVACQFLKIEETYKVPFNLKLTEPGYPNWQEMLKQAGISSSLMSRNQSG